MSEVCSEYEAERSSDSDEIKKKRFEKLLGLMQKVSHIQSNLHVQPLVVGDQAINSNTTHQNFLMKIGTSRKPTLLVSELILGLIIFHCFQSQPLATTWRMVCSTRSLYGCNIVGQQLPALLYVPCCVRLPTLIAQSLKLVNLLVPCKRMQHCWELLRAFASSVR